MTDADSSKVNKSGGWHAAQKAKARKDQMNAIQGHRGQSPATPQATSEMLQIVSFLENVSGELEGGLDLSVPNPYLRMALHLLEGHFDAKIVTPTSLIGASQVPYATATRRLREMVDAGLIEQRARTKTGKSFSMHPSEKLLDQWGKLSGRIRRLTEAQFGGTGNSVETKDYFFGGSYMSAQVIQQF